MGANLSDRFWAKVEKTGDCWLWCGSKTQGGYGHTSLAGKAMGAHRAAYIALVGPIPEGLEIDHLCRVRNCVNPEHLEPVTPEENRRRAAAAKTHCKRGHELSGDNLAHSKPSRRVCLTCRRDSDRARHRAARAALPPRESRGVAVIDRSAEIEAARAQARAEAHAAHKARVRAILWPTRS